MNLKISYKFYIYVLSIIWLVYAFFLVKSISDGYDFEFIVGIIIGGFTIYLSVNSFLYNWYKNGRPKLLDWFRLSSFLFIVLNFFSLIDAVGTEVEAFREYIIPKEYMLPAIVVVLVGFLGLKVGEVLSVIAFEKKKVNKSNFKITYELTSINVFYCVAVFTAILQLYLILKGEVGYGVYQENTTSDISFVFQIVFIVSKLILSIFTIFKYLYKKNGVFFNGIFAFYFLIQILYGFLSGMKESVIVPVIIILIPYLMGGNKIPKKLVYSAIFFGLLLYPLNDNYRTVLNDMPSVDKKEAFLLATVKTFNLNLSDNLSEGSGSFSNRLSLFPYLVYSVQNEANWNYYKDLDRYVYLPFAWIVPRVMIPDKPKSETGEVLNYMIRGWSGNSLTPTTYGWAYFEGGYFYVLVLFVFFGFFITFFEVNLKLSTFFGLIIYIDLLITLLKVESDIYFLVSGILQSCLINYLFYRFFIRKIKLQISQS